MKVRLSLTSEARRRYAVETGRVAYADTVLDVPLEKLTDEDRATVIAMTGVPAHRQAVPQITVVGPYGGRVIFDVDRVPVTPEDWVTLAKHWERVNSENKRLLKAREEEARAKAEQAMREFIERASRALQENDDNFFGLVCRPFDLNRELDPAYSFRSGWAGLDGHELAKSLAERVRERHRELHRAWYERQAEAERERRAEAEREKARREAEKAAWIAEHGSEFLKKAYESGYDCQRRYVMERAAVEHPGYAVDFDGKAGWQDRACPSKEALEEALRVGGTVVWLISPPDPEEDDDAFGRCEAVLVSSYLGKYHLIKALR